MRPSPKRFGSIGNVFAKWSKALSIGSKSSPYRNFCIFLTSKDVFVLSCFKTSYIINDMTSTQLRRFKFCTGSVYKNRLNCLWLETLPLFSIIIYTMMNKNCANYTDFTENHYQKKIVQAPGGESHFSLAWSDEKTDYGPPRNSRSLGKQKNPPSQ